MIHGHKLKHLQDLEVNERNDILSLVLVILSSSFIPLSSNGRTDVFEASYRGSNPCEGTLIINQCLWNL